MSTVEPSELHRRATAVKLTRLLLPLYVALVVALFGPVALRWGAGVEALPQPLAALWSDGAIVAMIIVLVVWYVQVTNLGQWRPGGGPRFSLLTAVFEGRWEPTGPESPAERALRTVSMSSPLGVLASDVADLVGRLTAAGQLSLARSLTATIREAEGLASAVELVPAHPDPGPARSAVGRFEDNVQQLRRLPGALSEADAKTWTDRLEADLVDLRAAADSYRRPSGG